MSAESLSRLIFQDSPLGVRLREVLSEIGERIARNELGLRFDPETIRTNGEIDLQKFVTVLYNYTPNLLAADLQRHGFDELGSEIRAYLKPHSEEPWKSVLLEPLTLENCRECARKGLESHEIRRKVWPVLLPERVSPATRKELSISQIRDLKADAMRASISLLPWGESPDQWKGELFELLKEVFSRHPDFCYYQGYTDLCWVFLLISGPELGLELVERVNQDHFQELLRPREGRVELVEGTFTLLQRVDPDLHRALLKHGLPKIYIESWIQSWFAHYIKCLSDLGRIFDFLLAVPHPLGIQALSVEAMRSVRGPLLSSPSCDLIEQTLYDLPEGLTGRRLSLRPTE